MEVSPCEFGALRCIGVDGTVALTGSCGCIVARLNDGRVSLSHIPVVPGSWCCEAISEDTICYAGYCNAFGCFATTHDGGTTWHRVGISDNGVFDVFFMDNLRGWALVGSYGGILVWGTSDGGLSWSRLTQPQRAAWPGYPDGLLGLSSPFKTLPPS
jgi:hypothetical protein